MGIIGYKGDLNMFKGDLSLFNIVKVRDNWTCNKCRAKILKGNYCWGTNYQKFCLNCGFKVGHKFILDLESFLESLKRRIKALEKEEEKYSLINAVESI